MSPNEIGPPVKCLHLNTTAKMAAKKTVNRKASIRNPCNFGSGHGGRHHRKELSVCLIETSACALQGHRPEPVNDRRWCRYAHSLKTFLPSGVLAETRAPYPQRDHRAGQSSASAQFPHEYSVPMADLAFNRFGFLGATCPFMLRPDNT